MYYEIGRFILSWNSKLYADNVWALIIIQMFKVKPKYLTLHTEHIPKYRKVIFC